MLPESSDKLLPLDALWIGSGCCASNRRVHNFVQLDADLLAEATINDDFVLPSCPLVFVADITGLDRIFSPCARLTRRGKGAGNKVSTHWLHQLRVSAVSWQLLPAPLPLSQFQSDQRSSSRSRSRRSGMRRNCCAGEWKREKFHSAPKCQDNWPPIKALARYTMDNLGAQLGRSIWHRTVRCSEGCTIAPVVAPPPLPP